jgi:effector-binding domain-containing protein
MPDRDPVDDVLRRHTQVEIPAEVEARMRRQLTAFRTRVVRSRPPVREQVASLFRAGRYGWAAAGAVLAAALAIVVAWGGSADGRVYAAAVSRLASARSVQYTMELAPFVTIEFSHLAPGRERIVMSWGIEVRTDGSGAQLVLLHEWKQYVLEQGDSSRPVRTADLIEQLMSLPRTADAMLGERAVGGKQVVGYRVLGTRLPGEHGVEWLDLWLDTRSGTLDHVDVTPMDAGASGYRMRIRDVRVDTDLDPTRFDMVPPPGYSEASPAIAAERQHPGSSAGLSSLQPEITQATQHTAVVLPMRGSYLQARAAASSVAAHLQQRGVVPVGPAFGRFESESHWEVGYPVPADTTTSSPFELVTVPGGPVASLVVQGPWGESSAARWSRLLAWLGEHGYVGAGPPTEMWLGDPTNARTQITQMQIAVVPR